MKRIYVITTLALLLVACVGAATYWFVDTNRYKTVPSFSLTDLSGTVHQPSDWRGHVLVMNFWATWCKPCREEIPMLVQAQKELADDGVQILGLALDHTQQVKRFADKYNINYPVLLPMAEVARFKRAVGGSPGLPFTVIVDRKGRIRARVLGRIDRKQLNKLVAPLLKH